MAYGGASVQAVSLRLSPRRTEFDAGLMIDKVAVGQGFSEYFGFPCQFSFHQLLRTHLSSGAGTTGQMVADIPSGLSLTQSAKLYHYLHHHWQKSLVCAIAFLRRLCQMASAFKFFGFHDDNLFTEHVLQSCVQPPTWMTRSLCLCTPVTGWSSYTFRQRIPLYDSHGRGGSAD
jgi:hypothetical protein